MSSNTLCIVQVGTMMPFYQGYKKGPIPRLSQPHTIIPRDFFMLKKGPPMFTQKHYVALADLIHKRRIAAKEVTFNNNGKCNPVVDEAAKTLVLEHINQLTLDMCSVFEKDNPKFKKFTFIEACNRDLKDA